MKQPPHIESLDEETIAWLRTKTPAEKIKTSSDLHETARKIVATQIRQEHPDWDEARVQKQVAWRILNKIDLPELTSADLPRV